RGRCADRGRVEHAELVVVFLDEVGDLQEERLPLIGLEFAPRAFERCPRCGDSTVDVLRVALRNGCQQVAGRGVAALEGFAGGGAYHSPLINMRLTSPLA